MTREQCRQMWAQRLERYKESDQSVAEFCRHENVSQASFYQWKRRLGDQADSAAPQPVASTVNQNGPAVQRFTEVTVVGSADSHSPIATAKLANGIQIELGQNRDMVAAIVEQLLQHDPRKEMSTCSN